MSQDSVREVAASGPLSGEGELALTAKSDRFTRTGHRECEGGSEASPGAAGRSLEDADFPGGRTRDAGRHHGCLHPAVAL